MTVTVEPELNIKLSESSPPIDLKDRMESAANTAAELAEHGLDVEPTKEDKDTAAKIVNAYANDPEKTSKKVAEKSEVTITHQSTDDIKEKLRSKLAKLVSPADEVESAVVIDGETLDVDKELGLEGE